MPPLRTVARVELERYFGTWYEIASFPQSFQRGCTATMATYALRGDGDIDVVNRCRKGSLDGKEKSARGRAQASRGRRRKPLREDQPAGVLTVSARTVGRR